MFTRYSWLVEATLFCMCRDLISNTITILRPVILLLPFIFNSFGSATCSQIRFRMVKNSRFCWSFRHQVVPVWNMVLLFWFLTRIWQSSFRAFLLSGQALPLQDQWKDPTHSWSKDHFLVGFLGFGGRKNRQWFCFSFSLALKCQDFWYTIAIIICLQAN